LDEPGLTQEAAKRAYTRAGISPQDVQVAEVHDSTALCEIYQIEMLGLCGEGEGAKLAVEGVTARDGRLPVNPSGGLISRGHPLAATGLGQTHEIVTQLRGEAGARQAGQPSIGLVQNAGGLIGLDEAICAVTVLSRS
jgi:acetyl-CoA acetyltransferase